MRTALLFSGGKDSAYALLLNSNVDLLIGLTGRNGTQFHAGAETSEEFRRAQVALTGLPSREIELPDKDYLRAMFSGLQRIVADEGITHLVTGDLWHPYSNGIGDALAAGLGVEIVRPGKEICPGPEYGSEYVKRIIDSGIDARVTSVMEGVAPREWLGRKLDDRLLDEMRRLRIDPTGEGAEYQTAVVAGPMMRGKIVIMGYEAQRVPGRRYSQQFLRLDLTKWTIEPEIRLS